MEEKQAALGKIYSEQDIVKALNKIPSWNRHNLMKYVDVPTLVSIASQPDGLSKQAEVLSQYISNCIDYKMGLNKLIEELERPPLYKMSDGWVEGVVKAYEEMPNIDRERLLNRLMQIGG